MHKRTALYLCFILILTTSVFALSGSFRAEATGDLLYGDFDNDLDPIYIWDNDGYRIYSTLSNLSSSTDNVFSDSAANDVYLFGVSGNFGFPDINGWQSKTMFLIQLADSRTDFNHGLDTDFDSNDNDTSGSGFLSGNWTLLHDNNNDNIFDTRGVYTSTADHFKLNKNRDWRLVQSYKRDKTIIGISFSHYPYGTDSYHEVNNQNTPFHIVTNPAHTYSYSNQLIQTDLSSQLTLENRQQAADYQTIHEQPTNIFQIAFETPFNMISNSEIRFDISYESRTDILKEANSYSSYRDVSIGTNIDKSNESETLHQDSDQSGYVIRSSLRLTKQWDAKVYSWFDIGYGAGNFDANRTYVDSYNRAIQLPNIGNTEVNTYSYLDQADFVGDTEYRNSWLNHKTVFDLTENFTFAAGLRVDYITNKTDWKVTYSILERTAYDNGDLLQDTIDYITTSVSGKTTNHITESKSTTISLPVAMEYTMGRWTFRLGAEHKIERLVNESRELVLSSAPGVTTYIDGNSDTTITTTDNNFLSTSQATESQWSHTNFVYGLQFMANENLKIELIQYLNTSNVDFINTNFYRQLRLSLTVLL